MFADEIQFQLPKGERDWSVVLPHQLLSIRQSAYALEFLRLSGSGSPTIIAVEGMNLGILRRAVLCGSCPMIRCGPFGPDWARCYVTRIRDRLSWTKTALPLAPDPNPIGENFFSFETGTTRDLWPHDSLEAFAISRRRTDSSFMLQFPHQHAFVLEAEPTQFLPMLRTFQAARFRVGMPHRFSPFTRNPYFCPVEMAKHTFKKVRYEQRNLAARGEWEVLLDYRDSRRPEIGISI